MTTWTDSSSSQTSWAMTPSTDEVSYVLAGSPVGLLLTITLAITRTTTIEGDTQWGDSSSIQTAWSN